MSSVYLRWVGVLGLRPIDLIQDYKAVSLACAFHKYATYLFILYVFGLLFAKALLHIALHLIELVPSDKCGYICTHPFLTKCSICSYIEISDPSINQLFTSNCANRKTASKMYCICVYTNKVSLDQPSLYTGLQQTEGLPILQLLMITSTWVIFRYSKVPLISHKFQQYPMVGPLDMTKSGHI